MYFIDSKRIFWKKVDDEVVILDIDTGVYYTLNEVGARVWELLLEGQKLEGVMGSILADFNVSRDVVYKDIQRIIKELLRADILLEKKGA